jgi:hypothetical protein
MSNVYCTILTPLFYNSNYFFFYDQPLDLFSYIWALNIQWLILKKKKLLELCKSFVRNITQVEYVFTR